MNDTIITEKLEATEFERFQELFWSGKVTKQYEKELEKASIKWYESIGAKFGSHSDSAHKWAYKGGSLLFNSYNVGWYNYSFIMMLLHFEIWSNQAFVDGFDYTILSEKRDRDANPYSRIDFFNRRAWDCGYILGLQKNKRSN